MAELKPCPFCGEMPELIICNLVEFECLQFGVTWVVNCGYCLTRKVATSKYRIDLGETIQILRDGKNDVIEMWNRRAEDGT